MMALCFLKHEWERLYALREYNDYCGNRVIEFMCECTKCKKRKKKKFMGW
ncbi:MAG: hypothetical protein ACI3XA_06790 [Clostridia bacterium]